MVMLLVLGDYFFGYVYVKRTPKFTEDENALATPKAKHYTILFNTFVFLHLFNQINCRKVGIRDFNVFAQITRNWYFLAVLSAEVVI